MMGLMLRTPVSTAIAVYAILLIGRSTPCKAVTPPSAELRISSSDVIAVGTLLKYAPDASAPRGPAPSIQIPGTYTFAVQDRLKGECPDNLTLSIKALSYGGYGVSKAGQFPQGKAYLLFLKATDSGLTPMARDMPIIPIGANAKAPSRAENNDLAHVVKKLLVDSVEDSGTRAIALHVLEGTKDDDVARAALRWMDDSDADVRSNALGCLATNQIVDAIARIAQMEDQMEQSGRGISNISALDRYQQPQARPYLHALLFDTGSKFTRINAISALSNSGLADRSSIPYLMVALRDPEPQGEVAFIAHNLLHKLIPELGPAKDHNAFLKEPRDLEIQTVEKWWTDELAGNHGDRSTSPLIRPRSSPPPVPSTPSNSRAGRGPAD